MVDTSAHTSSSHNSSPSSQPELGELFHAAFRGLRRTWSEQLSPWDLTPHQWRALMNLLRHRPAGSTCPPAESMRLKDLAEQLRIAPRSATEVVDQLEAKGLVRREADPSDRRATLIVATDAGLTLFRDVSAERREQSQEYFSKLDAGERAELARLLGKLAG